MAIPISTSRSHLYQAITSSRELSDDLQRQLATGLKSETYGGVGLERRQLIEFNADFYQAAGYMRAIDHVQIGVSILDLTLTELREAVVDTRTTSLSVNFELDTDGRSLFQNESAARFNEVATILNTEAGGRYVYSGREVDKKPVEGPDKILNGEGNKAGYYQIANERQQADLGADLKGRVAVTQPSASEVNIAEDGVHPFGIKLTGLNSQVTGITATGPTGSPAALNFDVTANTAIEGETITIALTLPDGTERDLVLKAVTGTPANPGEFEIGATADDTATNIQAALNTELLAFGETELIPASNFAASNDFFDFDATTPPQRVAGPPYASATALTDATTTDTVIWYKGELNTDDPRGSQTVKVDDYVQVEYGARANEDAFVSALKNLAVASYQTYNTGDPKSQVQYDAMRSRVTDNLTVIPGRQNIDHMLSEVSSANSAIASSKERHETHSNLLQQFIDDIQNADIYEVGVQILDMQTRLQATYQVMSTLSQLSLVNYL